VPLLATISATATLSTTAISDSVTDDGCNLGSSDMENQPNHMAYWGKNNEVVWMRVAVWLEGVVVEEVSPVDVAGL